MCAILNEIQANQLNLCYTACGNVIFNQKRIFEKSLLGPFYLHTAKKKYYRPKIAAKTSINLYDTVDL